LVPPHRIKHYRLFLDSKGIPFVLAEAGLGHRILGELFLVSDALLSELDRFEGVDEG
jgi:hypothetical protein